MPKRNTVKKHQSLESEDFVDIPRLIVEESSNDEAIMGMMAGFIEAHRHEQKMAFDLTKLIVDHNKDTQLSEKDILSTFKRASKVVSELSPTNDLWEQLKS